MKKTKKQQKKKYAFSIPSKKISRIETNLDRVRLARRFDVFPSETIPIK